MSNYAECIDDMLGAAKEVQTPAAQYYKRFSHAKHKHYLCKMP